MRYHPLSLKKIHFIVTPEELRTILKGFHHVIVSTGVGKDYVESDPNDFLDTYDAMYQKCRREEKLIWEKDYDIVWYCTGITQHLENCIYQPARKCRVPDFAEPCPCIETFCLVPWNDQLSTSFTVTQFPEYVCGLCLSFPTRIEYEASNEKHVEGVIPYAELDDFETYEMLVSRIKQITKPLKLEYNGLLRRTLVRISEAAKADFLNFYFVTSNNISIIG